MPHYSFRTIQGDQPETNSIADCRDDDAAKREAEGMFADTARDVSQRLESSPDWRIVVMDDIGDVVFRIKVTAESRGKSSAISGDGEGRGPQGPLRIPDQADEHKASGLPNSL